MRLASERMKSEIAKLQGNLDYIKEKKQMVKFPGLSSYICPIPYERVYYFFLFWFKIASYLSLKQLLFLGHCFALEKIISDYFITSWSD